MIPRQTATIVVPDLAAESKTQTSVISKNSHQLSTEHRQHRQQQQKQQQHGGQRGPGT